MDPTGCKAAAILYSYAAVHATAGRHGSSGSAAASMRSYVVTLDLRSEDSILHAEGSPPPPIAVSHCEVGTGSLILSAIISDPRSAAFSLIVAEGDPLPPRSLPQSRRRGGGSFACIAPRPVRMYRISVKCFLPDGSPAAAAPLSLWTGDSTDSQSFALDDEEADESDSVDADAALLAALDDKGRLFIGKRGGDRMLMFDAGSGALLGTMDTPRLRAITSLLAGYVAVHADSAVFCFNYHLDIVAELGDDLLEGVVRMTFDAARCVSVRSSCSA